MQIEATTTAALKADADTIAVGVFDGERVAHDLETGELRRLFDRGEAKTAFRHLAVVHAGDRRVILAGLGRRDEFACEAARAAAAAVQGRARELGTSSLCWEVPHHVGPEVVAGLVEGTALGAYRFDAFRPAGDGAALERLLISDHHDVSAVVRETAVIVAAQNRARDLGNTPANELTPSALADYAVQLAARVSGLSATVIGEADIRAAGMGAFAAVAQGSDQEARLIRLDYDGGGSGPLLGLIGKGITFDSGGLALKQRAGMEEMKFDMAGGAAVIEAVRALALLDSPARVVCLVGATENLPGGRSVKPGDIVRALDGTTIEINNPDAEGRLVLADCIALARQAGCDAVVDIATLTVIDMALGSTYAAVMSNDDRLASAVVAAGERTGELVWRMPLHREFADMVKGRYAQLTNRTERRVAMPITAAEFLHHFAGDVPWAHLDIAGTAWDGHKPYFDKGATGFGVRLLVEVARTAFTGAAGWAGATPESR